MPSKQQAKAAKVASKKTNHASTGKADYSIKVSPPSKSEPKRSAPAGNSAKVSSGGAKKTKSNEQMIKKKTGAAVDSLVPNKDAYKVFVDGDKTYSATLNQSNLDANNNKFYIIQILQLNSNDKLYFWNRWGRVGVPGQNAIKGPISQEEAIKDFNNKHRDKTVKGDYR